MTAQLATQAASFSTGATPLAPHLARTAQAWRNYRRYRAIAAELRRLTIRDLEDIGLARADLDAVARKAVYGA